MRSFTAYSHRMRVAKGQKGALFFFYLDGDILNGLLGHSEGFAELHLEAAS